jgi:hypothetical protein
VAVFHTLEDLRELEPPPMAADTPERRALAREAIGAGLPGLAAQPSSVGRARFVRGLCVGESHCVSKTAWWWIITLSPLAYLGLVQ